MILNKPVVGIVPTYNLTNEANDPYQDRASFVYMYVSKITECGGVAIGLLDKNVLDYLPICDAYIWPGGNKILKEFYPIIEDVMKNHKPLLGVCLGMQAITTFFNVLEDKEKFPELSFKEVYDKGKEENPYLGLADNVPFHSHYVTKEEETINNARHEIKIKDRSTLKSIYEVEKKEVVSLHGYIVKRIPKILQVTAQTTDNVVEAIEYKDFILGVQFHPEIEKDAKIFTWLVDKALENKSKDINGKGK